MLTGGVWGQLARALGKRRWLRTVAEAGYDTVAWICGLLVAAGAASGLAGASDAVKKMRHFAIERLTRC